ncbi:MAG: glycosyltransferase family 2 protein [Candidatus Omnitrophica bacterium]|nr:glycosyltransferase family 2 protein [Candidatus Omnitrophota bacterium]
METANFSVVIIAKNEAARIEDCINSCLVWADEIIVVDDESTDDTVKISKRLGARVLTHRMDVEGLHRNWANAQSNNDWVLSLDADERLTKELKAEINETLSANPKENAFTIPRRNFIGDYWLRWGGQYPAAQIKLFRKSKFKWEEAEVHPRALLDGECGHLTKDIIHYTYRNWGDFLKKLNNQTTLEAVKWHKLYLADPKKANYKMNFVHALWRTIDRFFRVFIGKRGYKDGFTGFMIAYFSSVYQMVSYAKYKEINRSDKKTG